jgi:hypothetical protein
VKTIEIETETRPLAELLPAEDNEEVIYLTRGGRARFVLVPLDEGDEEVLAVRKNEKLMAHIGELVERARKGTTKSLRQLRAELELDVNDSTSP